MTPARLPSRLLVLVPARGGSKRLPGKNLRELAGRSLLAHTAAAVAAAGLGAPVVLSTDDGAIAAEGERLGWLVPFRRPAALAGDAAPTIAAVVHALDWWRETHGEDPGAVMVLQPTSPLRGGASLRAAAATLEARADVNSIIAVTALHVPPARLYLATADGIAAPLSQDDARRPVYVPNGALYLTRTPALRRRNTLFADPIWPLVLDPVRGLDIDTEAEWRLAEAALAAGLPPEPEGLAPAPSADGALT